MQLMAPMDFVACCWLSFFCELSFLVVSVFSYCFNRSRVKSYVLVSAFLWKIKSETAANVPLTLCSNQQISTPISKLTLKPKQPPQEQACRSICTGKVCFFFHGCIKVAHVNQVCDPINCGTIDFQVYAEIPKSPHESGLQLAMTPAIQKGSGFSCSHKAVPKVCQRGLQKMSLQSCTSLRSLSSRFCFFWNFSQSSTEIRMGDSITRSWWFCSF